MIPAGNPLTGLSKLFPDINVQGVGNEIKVNIPAKDIVEALKKNLREDLRHCTTIQVFPDGILMRIDIVSSLLGKLRSVSPNIRVNPDVVEVFIPKEDIIAAFKSKNPNINIEYSDKGVTISVRLV